MGAIGDAMHHPVTSVLIIVIIVCLIIICSINIAYNAELNKDQYTVPWKGASTAFIVCNVIIIIFLLLLGGLFLHKAIVHESTGAQYQRLKAKWNARQWRLPSWKRRALTGGDGDEGGEGEGGEMQDLSGFTVTGKSGRTMLLEGPDDVAYTCRQTRRRRAVPEMIPAGPIEDVPLIPHGATRGPVPYTNPPPSLLPPTRSTASALPRTARSDSFAQLPATTVQNPAFQPSMATSFSGRTLSLREPEPQATTDNPEQFLERPLRPSSMMLSRTAPSY